MTELILRWKKTTRALRKDEQEYGNYLTGILESRTDEELAYFSDPVEAAAFFCLLDLAKKLERLHPAPCAFPVPGFSRGA